MTNKIPERTVSRTTPGRSVGVELERRGLLYSVDALPAAFSEVSVGGHAYNYASAFWELVGEGAADVVVLAGLVSEWVRAGAPPEWARVEAGAAFERRQGRKPAAWGLA